MTYENADFKCAAHTYIAMRFARWYMDTGYEHYKELFYKYEDLVKRYEWAMNMITCRSCCSHEEMQEMRRQIPSFYRVRPQ